MPIKKTTTPKTVLSQAVDDLKVIHGIGHVTEIRLQDNGIRTFTQLAMQSPEDIATLLGNISASEIRKQRWILQARRFAGKKTKGVKPNRVEKSDATHHQHYQNFTLEFLLDEKNRIRRLRVTHIQSGDVDTWTGWCLKEISQFLTRHAGVRIPYTHPVPQKHLVPSPANKKAEPAQETINPFPLLPVEPAIQAQPIVIHSLPPDVPPPPTINHPLQLLKWVNSLPDSDNPIQSISQGSNFDVQIILDISKTSLFDCHHLAVTGMLFAKKLGSGSRQVVGETQLVIPYTPIITLGIHNTSLTSGIYRQEALVTLRSAEGITPPTEIDASFQGGIFQVY